MTVGPRGCPRDRGAQGLPDQLGAVVADLVGRQVGARLDGQTREQSGLAAGTGAQVQPLLGPVGLDGHGCQRQRDQLRALVLDRRPPFTHRRYAARVASLEDRTDGESEEASAPASTSSATVARPGRATRDTFAAALSAVTSAVSSPSMVSAVAAP